MKEDRFGYTNVNTIFSDFRATTLTHVKKSAGCSGEKVAIIYTFFSYYWFLAHAFSVLLMANILH